MKDTYIEALKHYYQTDSIADIMSKGNPDFMAGLWRGLMYPTEEFPPLAELVELALLEINEPVLRDTAITVDEFLKLKGKLTDAQHLQGLHLLQQNPDRMEELLERMK